MIHHASADFWRCYDALPTRVRDLADKNFALLKSDPRHPSLQTRSNTTHESVTDPDARLARKSNGTASTLWHLGSVLMDNRHGLIVATDVRPPGY